MQILKMLFTKYQIFEKFKLHWRLFALLNFAICLALRELFVLSLVAGTFHPILLLTSLAPTTLISIKEAFVPSGNIYSFWIAYCLSVMIFVLAFFLGL